jgi:NAD(P)-dependent dehydrogenase (short-subunit alcohol dehydrogenase family)
MDDLAGSIPEAEIVCLNAGVVGAELGAPWDVPPDEWSRLVSVNVLGVVNGLRSFVPKLKKSGRASHIIITASLAGLITFPGGGAYAATKHATVTVAEQAAMMLAGTNVSVTLLCPALVRTGMSATGEDPDAVALAALEAARAGQFLVVPPEWTSAVVTRAEQLISGRVPAVPAPDASQ